MEKIQDCITNKHESRITVLETQYRERRRSSDKIEEKLDKLIEEQYNLKSFVAGVSMAFSFLAFLASLIWDYIKD